MVERILRETGASTAMAHSMSAVQLCFRRRNASVLDTSACCPAFDADMCPS